MTWVFVLVLYITVKEVFGNKRNIEIRLVIVCPAVVPLSSNDEFSSVKFPNTFQRRCYIAANKVFSLINTALF